MDDIKWIELPPKQTTLMRHQGRRQRFVAALRERPGAWAQYRPGEGLWASNASALKRDFVDVEVATRKRDDGKYDVYVRWVGNGDGEAS